MKILMISTEKLPVPPVLGGAIQTYIEGVLPHLGKVHEITVLGIQHQSLAIQETVDHIHYVRVAGDTFEEYQKEVTQFVAQHSFDYIHIFNRPRLVMPIRQVASHSKLILSMHNDMFTPEKIPPEEARQVLNEVSIVVTISNYIGNRICEFYPEARPKMHTIYSGVDSERFIPANHPRMRQVRDQLRKAHGLEGKTVILFAGRLSNNKGVDRLVRALPQLSERYKNLALVIVGSNWFSQNNVTDYVAYVRALASKLPIPVVTTGFVAPQEIHNWFAAADLFVCTSIWQEPLARVHYEAMAAGLPIVTTARGGNPEVIEPGQNGLIVQQPENPQEFVETISEMLSDPAAMKRMGERGRDLALTKYQWKRVASDILQVWERVGSMVMPSVIDTLHDDPAIVESLVPEVVEVVPQTEQPPLLEERAMPAALQVLSLEERIAEVMRLKQERQQKLEKQLKPEKHPKLEKQLNLEKVEKKEKKDKDKKKEEKQLKKELHLLNQPKSKKDEKKKKEKLVHQDVVQLILDEWSKASAKVREEKEGKKKKRKI